MSALRVKTVDINAVLKEFRRNSCAEVQRALAVALVQTREELQQLQELHAALVASTTLEAHG